MNLLFFGKIYCVFFFMFLFLYFFHFYSQVILKMIFIRIKSYHSVTWMSGNDEKGIRSLYRWNSEILNLMFVYNKMTKFHETMLARKLYYYSFSKYTLTCIRNWREISAQKSRTFTPRGIASQYINYPLYFPILSQSPITKVVTALQQC